MCLCVRVFMESERRERMAEASPPVTEIKVRIDCNGCVQKIKRAFQGIDGIEDVQVDLVHHKIIITGPADPAKLLMAIRKTRKSAVLSVNDQNSDHVTPPEGGGGGGGGTPSPAKEEPATRPQELNPESGSSRPEMNAAVAAARIDSSSSQPQVCDAQVNVFRPPTVGRYAHPVDPGASRTDNLRPPAAVTRYAVDPVCSAQPVFYQAGVAPPPVDSGGQSRRPAVYASHSNIFRPPEPITRYANPVPAAQTVTHNTDRPPAENSIFRPAAAPFFRSPARYTESEEDDDFMESSGNNIASVFSEDNPNSCNIA